MNQKQEVLNQVLQELPKNKLLTIEDIAKEYNAAFGEYLTTEELITMLKNLSNVSEVKIRQIYGKLFSCYVIRE